MRFISLLSFICLLRILKAQQSHRNNAVLQRNATSSTLFVLSLKPAFSRHLRQIFYQLFVRLGNISRSVKRRAALHAI